MSAHFGQHFLHDQLAITRIIDLIKPQKDDVILEIGPGKGALTKRLIKGLDRLHVVEIDPRMIQILRQTMKQDEARLHIHEQDILKYDLKYWHQSKIRIVGNLPYNISSAILFYLVDFVDHIADMTFMIQRDLAQRLCANHGNKIYGRITVILQYYFDIQEQFVLRPDSFQPRPKVDSSILTFVPKKRPIDTIALDFASFSMIVKGAFGQRRKILSNALKDYLRICHFEQADLSPKSRAEELSVEDFVRLANCYYQSKQENCG